MLIDDCFCSKLQWANQAETQIVLYRERTAIWRISISSKTVLDLCLHCIRERKELFRVVLHFCMHWPSKYTRVPSNRLKPIHEDNTKRNTCTQPHTKRENMKTARVNQIIMHRTLLMRCVNRNVGHRVVRPMWIYIGRTRQRKKAAKNWNKNRLSCSNFSLIFVASSLFGRDAFQESMELHFISPSVVF